MRWTIAILASLSAAGAVAQLSSEYGPFSEREAELMSAVWPQIREAADFDDIDWRSVGLSSPPGSAEARRVMEDNWATLRQERRFESIDWEDVDYRASSFGDRRRARDRDGQWQESPFTREEAEALSEVWPQIREAASFDHIDWRSVGLAGPPGDRQARRMMATHWDSLRSANRFEDIDWESLRGDRAARQSFER